MKNKYYQLIGKWQGPKKPKFGKITKSTDRFKNPEKCLNVADARNEILSPGTDIKCTSKTVK